MDSTLKITNQYCLYLRKSRADMEAEARGEGETLARHEKILLDLAKKQNLSITKIYREIVSGETIAARPVMQQLLNEVDQGLWSGVLVVEVERLARGDTMDQGIVAQSFKYSSTKIITPVKTYDPNNEFDEEYFEFGLFMSRREYKTINRRLQQGRIASVKEGKFLGTFAPFGYEKVKLADQKGYSLRLIPEQAQIVKMIFDMYTNLQQGVSLIVRKLNQMGIKPVKSEAWVTATIQDMLRNPVYMGKIRWNWRPTAKTIAEGQVVKKRKRAKATDWILVDGLHEPIIDSDTWNKTQKLLSQNPSPPMPARYKAMNPIGGLIFCGICGRRMVRRPYTKKGQSDTLMCPVASCDNVSSRLTDIEASLLNALKGWLGQQKLAWSKTEYKKVPSQINVNEKSLKKLNEDLKVLEKQQDNLHDLLEQGVYSIETFLERSKTVAEKAESIQASIRQINLDIDKERAQWIGYETLIPRVERVLDLYETATDPKAKNDLLKVVVEKAVYIKEKDSKWKNPNNYKLILYPKLPSD